MIELFNLKKGTLIKGYKRKNTYIPIVTYYDAKIVDNPQ